MLIFLLRSLLNFEKEEAEPPDHIGVMEYMITIYSTSSHHLSANAMTNNVDNIAHSLDSRNSADIQFHRRNKLSLHCTELYHNRHLNYNNNSNNEGFGFHIDGRSNRKIHYTNGRHRSLCGSEHFTNDERYDIIVNMGAKSVKKSRRQGEADDHGRREDEDDYDEENVNVVR